MLPHWRHKPSLLCNHCGVRVDDLLIVASNGEDINLSDTLKTQLKRNRGVVSGVHTVGISLDNH